MSWEKKKKMRQHVGFNGIIKLVNQQPDSVFFVNRLVIIIAFYFFLFSFSKRGKRKKLFKILKNLISLERLADLRL